MHKFSATTGSSTRVILKVAFLMCIAFVLGWYTQEMGRGAEEQKLWTLGTTTIVQHPK
jgi:cytochrome bd-type quinol oxidase subunit 1